MPTKYVDVVFEFFHAAYQPEVHYGTVLLRDREMVLEVELPGSTPYHIQGALKGSYFQGREAARPGVSPVFAKWILLDDTYVGLWVEEGQDFMFKFELPDPK
jgi:hypothetical protein